MHTLELLSSIRIEPLESGFHCSLHCFALAGAGGFFVAQMASGKGNLRRNIAGKS